MNWKTTRASLLSRVRDIQDDGAWQEFDAVYGELLLRYGRRRGLSLADAEDVRQIVLLSLSRTLPNFEFRPERGRFRGYLGRTLRNAIFRYRTSPKSSLPSLVSSLEDVGEIETDGADSEHDPVWEEEWRNHHLRQAFETVAEHHDEQSVNVFRRLLSGVTVGDLADESGLSTDAIYKIKQRIRDRLRTVLAEQIAAEDGEN